jgi:phosphatidylethanolamine-binding protein (PEBP) family uncharacterized protein
MPDLEWSGEPSGTKSFAIVFDDLSRVPMTTGYHYVIWNIGAAVHMLPMGMGAGNPPAGLTGTGTSTIKQYSPLGMQYLGPCPNNSGGMSDNYSFKIYALSQDSVTVTTMSVQAIQTAIEGMTPLATAELKGTSNAMGQLK